MIEIHNALWGFGDGRDNYFYRKTDSFRSKLKSARSMILRTLNNQVVLWKKSSFVQIREMKSTILLKLLFLETPTVRVY